ncbi:hypothetical protein WR25_00887 [Diploscapter pachys]|uniref:BZIP domain-containing protein n=1 Tax=Diploscapter pachys TaxID=2018661 RepID=A0A2A2KVR3_9BILA|nr:hypothetical protein WR25_00887 [Diploscapter pachys]
MWPEEGQQYFELSNSHVLYEPSCQMRSCYECSTDPCSMPIPSNDYAGSVDDYSPQGWTESKIPEVQSQQCVTYPSQYDPNNHQPNEQMELSKKEKTTRECSIQLDLDTVHDMSLNDLVDIVMQTVENVQKAEPRAKELDLITKKKEQNKRAAIRYREKQKQRWEIMATWEPYDNTTHDI